MPGQGQELLSLTGVLGQQQRAGLEARPVGDGERGGEAEQAAQQGGVAEVGLMIQEQKEAVFPSWRLLVDVGTTPGSNTDIPLFER